MPDEIGDLLRFDPVGAAERVAGADCNAPRTAAATLWLASAHADAKQAALAASGDTWHGSRFDKTLAVFASLGFEIVLDDPFVGDGGIAERFVVLWHPEGVLGSCESSSRWNSTNSCRINYAWRPHDPEGDWRRLWSSGFVEDGVLYGYHDTREGLRHTFNALRAEGSFLSDWSGGRGKPQPWSHLATYAEWDGGKGRDRWDAARAARYNRLPREIREAMGTLEATA